MPERLPPAAAYLYVLTLDGPGLAWEYLRRDARYQADWDRHGRGEGGARAAEPWGLRFPG